MEIGNLEVMRATPHSTGPRKKPDDSKQHNQNNFIKMHTTKSNDLASTMTKREKIASAVLQSLTMTDIPDDMKAKEWAMVMARASVRVADCLIFALNESSSKNGAND